MDRDAWIGIEFSAKEFHCFEDGVRAWDNYYARHEAELPGRMVFVETDSGEKVATATAFYDVRSDDHTDGWLHWVAVKREYQGRGLSKPLIAHTLDLLRAMGHTRTIIPTQTYTWLACKIYLDFGFRPIPANAVHSRDGWRIVRAITDHPALADFDPATPEEIFKVS